MKMFMKAWFSLRLFKAVGNQRWLIVNTKDKANNSKGYKSVHIFIPLRWRQSKKGTSKMVKDYQSYRSIIEYTDIKTWYWQEFNSDNVFIGL